LAVAVCCFLHHHPAVGLVVTYVIVVLLIKSQFVYPNIPVIPVWKKQHILCFHAYNSHVVKRLVGIIVVGDKFLAHLLIVFRGVFSLNYENIPGILFFPQVPVKREQVLPGIHLLVFEVRIELFHGAVYQVAQEHLDGSGNLHFNLVDIPELILVGAVFVKGIIQANG